MIIEQPVTAEMIKEEAQRRILQIMPVYKQINWLALKAEMDVAHGPNPAAWPVEVRQAVAPTLGLWAEIKAIRARSNLIEAMDPIPANYTADALWN